MDNSNLKSLAQHLKEQYGKLSTKEKEEFEEGSEAFRLGAMLQEMRKQHTSPSNN
jgi:HTH-type transcriptional regulator / antitoxin HipB